MIANLNLEHIDMILATHHIGHMGCHADGRTYVVPITYVYDDGRIVGHTNEGMKTKMLRQNPDVCVQVDDITDMRRWSSVIAWGQYEELKGEEAAKALDVLFATLAPDTASESTFPARAEADEAVAGKIKLRATKGVVYRINIKEKTGRFEHP